MTIPAPALNPTTITIQTTSKATISHVTILSLASSRNPPLHTFACHSEGIVGILGGTKERGWELWSSDAYFDFNSQPCYQYLGAIPRYELGHLDTMMELKRMDDTNSAGGLWMWHCAHLVASNTFLPPPNPVSSSNSRKRDRTSRQQADASWRLRPQCPWLYDTGLSFFVQQNDANSITHSWCFVPRRNALPTQ